MQSLHDCFVYRHFEWRRLRFDAPKVLRGFLQPLCQREFSLASPLTLPSPLNHHECVFPNGELQIRGDLGRGDNG